jgi:hypothetical protein
VELLGFLLTALICALLAGAVFRLMQARKESNTAQASQPGPVDPFADLSEDQFWKLELGDVVKFQDNDLFVRQRVENVEVDYRWLEFLLDNNLGVQCWLSVEDDNRLDLALWTEIPLAELTGKPGDDSVVVRGKAYRRKESGVASTKTEKKGVPFTGKIQYFQYEAADDSLLAMQSLDYAEWVISLGNRHLPSEFVVFPTNI